MAETSRQSASFKTLLMHDLIRRCDVFLLDTLMEVLSKQRTARLVLGKWVLVLRRHREMKSERRHFIEVLPNREKPLLIKKPGLDTPDAASVRYTMSSILDLLLEQPLASS